GFPELLGGKVKTLHPAVHAAVLARRADPGEMGELAAAGVAPIDLVAVNLYRFGEWVEAGTAHPEAGIDIGGAALLRAAAKNWEDVVVLCDPDDYAPVLAALSRGGVPADFRRRLAAKAFALTARYDAEIAAWMEGEEFPPGVCCGYGLSRRLRYGENPHQRAALYAGGPGAGAGLAAARQLHGKELSYNNIIDLDSALSLILEFSAPAAVIVKHTNPCGAALAAALEPAFRRALAADPKSAFGGIVALNREVDAATAAAAASFFAEAVVAPGFAPGALEILTRKKNLRLLETGPFRARDPFLRFRSVYGGLLLQDEDSRGWDPAALDPVTAARVPTALLPTLGFAWLVGKHVKSNAIVLARDEAVVGVGAGQMSRIDAARLALEKAADAGLDVRGAVLASDAFFPFRDVVDLAAAAGVAAIVQPGGSIRDRDSIRACDEHGLAMVFTGTRHFRH
ncbi:MAG TPA: bifunctional phosphoribosylaminoimidazolecarboxamide formyltransferase/IMP cyclohydrolase, partial [bacterium]|nr:bifunctional phosphoribosylaminoimidazolecarboxamide formyltransferase/IMP cyclohydrolase [bacterium]